MCERYVFDASPKLLKKRFGLADVPKTLQPQRNIAPTANVWAVRWNKFSRERELAQLRWWLAPCWVKSANSGYSMHRANAETVSTDRSFRETFKYRRCLIAATGYYAWREEHGHRQPYVIRHVRNEILAFAGLWERWEKNGETIDSCAIIVQKSSGPVRDIQSSMPVIIRDEDFTGWLDPYNFHTVKLASLLKEYPAELLTAAPVSSAMEDIDKTDKESCAVTGPALF